MKSTLLILLCIDCMFGIKSIGSLLSPRTWMFIMYVFYISFTDFVLQGDLWYSFFFLLYEMWNLDWGCIFRLWIANYYNTVFEKTVIFQLNCFCSFIKNKLAVLHGAITRFPFFFIDLCLFSNTTLSWILQLYNTSWNWIERFFLLYPAISKFC